MDLLEHSGKRLFAGSGLPVLPSRLARSPAEAQAEAGALGLPVVVKAQVKTGGRGKAGGIRRCATEGEVAAAAADILGMSIRGHGVSGVLVEQAVEVDRELYLAISCARAQRLPLLIFSAEGGVDIEQVARRSPCALVRTPVDPLLGLCDYQVRDVVAAAASTRLAGSTARRRGRRWPPSCAPCGGSITTATRRSARSTRWWSPPRARSSVSTAR